MRATHPVRADIDLLDGDRYAADAHEVWTWMREHAPVYFDAANEVWGITRYDDVLAIEKDPRRFSSRGGPLPKGQPGPMMIAMDAPQHTRRRALVNRGFTPRRIRERAPHIRALCDALIDEVCEKGECDVVADLAAKLPVIVIGQMLGFEPGDEGHLLRLTDDILGMTVNDEGARARSMAARGEFHDHQLAVAADRRSCPRDDLITALVQAEVDGEQLDDESLVHETLLLLTGGDETSRHVMSGGLLALLQHPDQQAAFLAGPEARRRGVEEMLRWVTPIKNMARIVDEDVEVGGQQLRAGDTLMLLYPSANRDDAVFEDPFRFDVGRDPNPHLAFGFGPHFCLGASLARLEVDVALERILTRLPDLQLVDEEPLRLRPSWFLSGLEALPVRFAPTPRVG